jgi:hypothetical protein
MKWDYPVYRAKDEPKGDATAVRQRQALSYEDALAYVRGNDPRPLLVLRECKTCNKTDNALLRPGSAENEKTILYSRWFHCVKLPVDVIQPDHPFNALFTTNAAPHFFVGTSDGATTLPLETATSRTELWNSMSTVLKKAYRRDPTSSFQDVQHELDKLDVLDSRISDLERQKSDLLESAGKLDASKVRKIDADLKDAQKEIAQIGKTIDKLMQVDLKPAAAAEPVKAGE